MTAVQQLALILLAIVASSGAAWQVQDWRYGTQLAEIGEAQAIAITKAGDIARAEEQRRQSAVNKVGSDAREEINAANIDAGNAGAAGERLYLEASKLAATACGDPGVAERGASAARAAMVLSDLLQRTDKRAGELAIAYDHARIAGLACETAYLSLTEPR
ncbi:MULTISPECIES: DUF2514 family protein [Pseudomonas]|uniref:DUF2514 family protein n=1 Tax=Pseudomonas TaxID=286 RepID=UPI000FDCDA10|nr:MULTISPECIES: DUF2514 family protein [Pseudomonas]MBJ2209675.1 DUF2514 domain-containing protein [Pseudomonas carnis]MDE1529810.1 DUF2514 family protein [Pseudomonas carnis]